MLKRVDVTGSNKNGCFLRQDQYKTSVKAVFALIFVKKCMLQKESNLPCVKVLDSLYL